MHFIVYAQCRNFYSKLQKESFIRPKKSTIKKCDEKFPIVKKC